MNKTTYTKSGFALVERMTDEEVRIAKIEEAAHEDLRNIVDFMVKRIQGKVGDILLTHECRMERLLDKHIEKFYTLKVGK